MIIFIIYLLKLKKIVKLQLIKYNEKDFKKKIY